MTADEMIEQALALGLYRVDVESGTVYGRRGRALAMPPNRDGYRTVTLCLGPREHRTVTVHRMVAMAAWGREAITDRQVAHQDGNQRRNGIANLWIPGNATEHYHHDEEVSGPRYRGGAPRKGSWPACARCGETDGPPHPNSPGGSPARVTGASFGIEGDLCWLCYRALHERERRRRKREGTDTSSALGEPGGLRGKDHRDEELEAAR